MAASRSLPLSVAYLFALIVSCHGARMKNRRDTNRRASSFSEDCPKDVQVNTKGDCMDLKGNIVAHHCCDHIRDCLPKIGEVMKYYNERTELYMDRCEVKRSDLEQKSDHEFAVVDDTRVCSDTCQGIDALKEPARSLDSWEIPSECASETSYQHLLMIHAVVLGLDNAWETCSTPSPSPSPELGPCLLSEIPADVCGDENHVLCYHDDTCLGPNPRLNGLGCNAGGLGQNCRFCGSLHYAPCPQTSTVVPETTTIIEPETTTAVLETTTFVEPETTTPPPLPCPSFTLETGFRATSGVYTISDRTMNGRPTYKNAHGAFFHYAVTHPTDGSHPYHDNWAAAYWLRRNCWAVEHAGHTRYAVATNKEIWELESVHGWQLRKRDTRWPCRFHARPSCNAPSLAEVASK